MAVYTPLQNTPIQLQDSVTSDIMSGGTLEFYLAGTTTATELYSDTDGTSIGTSITLNSGGFPSQGGNVITLFRNQSIALKIVGKNAAGAEVFTSDNIPAVASFDSTSSDKLDDIAEGADVTNATNVGAVVNGLQETQISFGDMFLPTTNPAAAETLVEGTAGMPNYRGYGLNGAGSAAENIDFEWLPPKRWDGGTVQLVIYYSTAAIDSDGVVLQAKAVALSDGDNYAQAYGTSVSVTDTLQGGAGKLLSVTTPEITIGGTPTDGDKVSFRIFRDPTHASDTADEDAVVTNVKVLWSSDALNDA